MRILPNPKQAPTQEKTECPTRKRNIRRRRRNKHADEPLQTNEKSPIQGIHRSEGQYKVEGNQGGKGEGLGVQGAQTF